jgi:hypothetical protein
MQDAPRTPAIKQDYVPATLDRGVPNLNLGLVSFYPDRVLCFVGYITRSRRMQRCYLEIDHDRLRNTRILG